MVAKENIMLYDRYYLQKCKAITLEKVASHTKYQKSNVPSYLNIFWVNFDKANHSFLHAVLLCGETIFLNAAWGNE